MTNSYDAIVIGAGQAGPSLAHRLGEAGWNTAIVERHLVGGTCVNVGCVPTKALVGSARIAWHARQAERFGVQVGPEVTVDMARVKARKDEIVGASHDGLTPDRIPCYGLFVDPPLGRVGMTERQVRESGRPALMATMPMTRVGRAREFGETRGFMKVLVDAESEKILGASILGLSGDEAVHALIDVMYARRPYTTLTRAVHIHPTVSELIPTLLQQLRSLDNG